MLERLLNAVVWTALVLATGMAWAVIFGIPIMLLVLATGMAWAVIFGIPIMLLVMGG